MANNNLYRTPGDQRLIDFIWAPGNRVAWTILLADAITMAFDNHGPIGLMFFVAGIGAALYLLARWFKDSVAPIIEFVRRPRGAPPMFVPARTLSVAALVLIATATGASLFKADGHSIEEALNLVSLMGFVSVVAFFALLTVATAIAWANQGAKR